MSNSSRRDCAGFIIFRLNGANLETLLIREDEKKVPVGFPKGKIELGETPFVTAQREVKEETGLSELWVTGEHVTELFYKEYSSHTILHCFS